MKIALALSGGGYRATVFHLGMLARLAEEQRLEDVNFLSTVSGGSLCAGLLFSLNSMRWPNSYEFSSSVLPAARRLLTTGDLQKSVIFYNLRTPWNIWKTRAHSLSHLMQKEWGVTARLCDLPEQPRWMINATCYETGKNWRFERFRMGDYLFGYSNDTQLPLADAMAASAGFPGLIGPIVLDTTKHRWFQYIEKTNEVSPDAPQAGATSNKTQPVEPTYPRVHLWDGGVYDNHGLEGLIDVRKGWRRQVEFLIVSDGAGRASPEKYRRGYKALLRLATGIMMDQIRSLRARIVLERLINHGDENKGSFIQIGNSGVQILNDARLQDEIPDKEKGFQNSDEVNRAAAFPTVIRKLTEDEFELLFRHGYEAANCTLYAYNRDQFAYIGYPDRTATQVVGR